MSQELASKDQISVAIITGQHLFHVPGFHALLRSLPGVIFYMQDLENFCGDEARVRDAYDVLLFYNYHRTGPEGKVLEALGRLGEADQGIFVMHHAILAFPEWDGWTAITGLRDRSFEYYHDETVNIHVCDRDHPISAGMSDWTMRDETYLMADASEGSQVLMTTEHPRSMSTVAWVRQHRGARVFCLESGHGIETYSDPNFRNVVLRGIQWAAGQL